jgi:hypothetical protein
MNLNHKETADVSKKLFDLLNIPTKTVFKLNLNRYSFK